MSRTLEMLKELSKGPLPVKHNEKGAIRELTCKGCRAQIAGMVVSDQEPQHVAMGDKLVVVTPVEFVHLSNYEEGTIEFDDRSAHVTHGCKVCMRALKMSGDVAALQDWYEQDLAVLIKELNISGGGWKLSESNLNRTPVRIV